MSPTKKTNKSINIDTQKSAINSDPAGVKPNHLIFLLSILPNSKLLLAHNDFLVGGKLKCLML